MWYIEAFCRFNVRFLLFLAYLAVGYICPHVQPGNALFVYGVTDDLYDKDFILWYNEPRNNQHVLVCSRVIDGLVFLGAFCWFST